MKKAVGIGLLGLGTVGSGIAEVLVAKADSLSEQAGLPLVLKEVLVRDSDKRRPVKLPSSLLTTHPEEVLTQPGVDIVIELVGGEHPATEYMERAIASGKHVVTANKEVMAKHGYKLFSLAGRYNADVRYEASVGSGIPLISTFQQDLAANRISAIRAILNGTTNYVLSRMAYEGLDFASTLKQTQEFGYAIKLLAIAKREDDRVEMRVHPVFISQDSQLAKVDGVYNAVEVETDLAGRLVFYGEGAGSLRASSAVMADVLAIAKNIYRGVNNVPELRLNQRVAIKPMSELSTRYYLRLNAPDRPGVLSQISKVLGDNSISISSVIQKESDLAAQTAIIVIMTYPAREKGMQKALKQLKELPEVNEVSNFIRVEE